MNRNWILVTTLAGGMLTGSAFAAGDYGQSSPGMGSQGAMQSPAGSAALSSDSEAVRQAQQALNEQGYDVGPIDGIYGPMTQDALRSFQQDQNMQATGQLDQQTASALGLEVSEFAAGEFENGGQTPSRGIDGADTGGGMDSGSSPMGTDQPTQDSGGMN